MALVEHERDLAVRAEAAAADDLVEDPEQLEWVGRSDDQVVVGVEARVEVERAEPAEAQQLRHDELDVGARRVVAGVQADVRPVAEGEHLRVGGSPVGDVHVVERRLEELVLEDESLVVADPRVDLLQGVGEAVLAGADVVLAGVVGAVGEPDLEVARARGVHHVDALEVVVDRLLADAGIPVGQAAELVVVVLEGVGVDRAELHAEVLRVGAQRGVVVDLVPRDVQRDLRSEAGEFVDLGGIRDLLPRIAGYSGLGEYLEAGARVAEGPGGELDDLGGKSVEDVVVDHRVRFLGEGVGSHVESFQTCRQAKIARAR